MIHKDLNDVLALSYPFQIDQGFLNPGPQQTTSHGRLGFIQIPIQATMFLPSSRILCQIKTSLGRKVHLQEIANLIMMGFFEVAQFPHLCLVDILEKFSSRFLFELTQLIP